LIELNILTLRTYFLPVEWYLSLAVNIRTVRTGEGVGAPTRVAPERRGATVVERGPTHGPTYPKSKSK